MVNNGTIQQFFYPVHTFLKDDPLQTAVQIPKEAAPALKATASPSLGPEKEELVENVTTEFLNSQGRHVRRRGRDLDFYVSRQR